MSSIDILIPVLGRPQNAQKVVDSIHANTVVPHTCIFICSRGDHAEIEACKATKVPVLLCDEDRYAVKINKGATWEYRDTPHELLFLAADDLAFHRDWDRAAIDEYHASGRPVIGTNDLGNKTVMAGEHATHSLVHRSYIEAGTIDEPGKLLHEGYRHNFCDTEFVDTAKSRGAFTFAFESHVEHLHPFWQKGPDDLIYRKGRRTFPADRRTYYSRRPLWQ
jgi:hypothetical protein